MKEMLGRENHPYECRIAQGVASSRIDDLEMGYLV